MSKQLESAVIDFGSSKITIMVGTPSSDGNIIVIANGESSYSGFGNGELFEVDEISKAISKALDKARAQSKFEIKELFVGVPGEFVTVATNDSTITFNKRRKINADDVKQLFDYANKFGHSVRFTPISRSPIYYMLDDGRHTVDPIGQLSSSLYGLISFAFVENNFKNVVSSILKNLGISKCEFVSGNLAQSLFLLEPSIRDNVAILIDVGYITSNVMVVKGDGLLFIKSFSTGSGHIAADLAEVLPTDFVTATKLRNKVNLNLEYDETDTYDVDGKQFKSILVDDIIKARIEDIADSISTCLKMCENNYPSDTVLYLTGGGLTYMKGAVSVLSKAIGKNVNLIMSDHIETRKPEYSSTYGLLDIPLKQSKPIATTSFWKKILG